MDIDWHDRYTMTAGGIYVSDNTGIPEQFEYVCLDGVIDLGRALRVTSDVPDVLVVRPEYDQLRDAVEKIPMRRGKVNGIVVTGQSGIGSCGSQSPPELNLNFSLAHSQEKPSSSYTSFCIAYSTSFRQLSNSILTTI
jgi:hypothetical protein